MEKGIARISLVSILSGMLLTNPLAGVRTVRSEPTVATGYRQAKPNQWTYSSTSDKFKGTVHKASILSPTRLEFAYPYSGGSTATLTVRQKDNTLHIYVEVSKGQFNRSFQGGNALIAFDNAPAKNYPLLAAANGRANIVFLDADKRFIDRLKRSARMLMTMEFQGQGKHQLAFRTAGLRWDH